MFHLFQADVIERLRLQYKKDLLKIVDIVLSHQVSAKDFDYIACLASLLLSWSHFFRFILINLRLCFVCVCVCVCWFSGCQE